MRLYFQVEGSAWSIVVMPYEVRIDNFHGFVHIHPPRGREPSVRVRDMTMTDARTILESHLRRHQALLFRSLLEEFQ